MDLASIILIILAVALVSIVVYSIVLVLTRWYFSLSPSQIAGFSLLMFLMGIMVESYLDLNNVNFFISSVLIFVLVLFWMYKIFKTRTIAKQLKEVS
jgi:predicted neutral ceramidase superfamily lipid hydrolase